MNTKWISESSLMTTLRQREESMKIELMKLKKENEDLKNTLIAAYHYLKESKDLKRDDDLITDKNKTFLSLIEKAINK